MQVIWQGSIVGSSELTNFAFRTDRPYAGCLICGRVFQSELDRTASTEQEQHRANQLRQLWRIIHAKSHSETQHEQLAQCKAAGQWCLPEAAEKLAPFGIFSLTDLVLADEQKDALRLARRAPENDADSPTRDMQLRVS